MEVDDESCDSHATDDDSESDLDFNHDELVDDFDDLELSDEDPDAYVDELNSSDEIIDADGGFTAISNEEPTPILIFRAVCTEGILHVITEETNTYGKGKKGNMNNKKTDRWKDGSKAEIDSFKFLITCTWLIAY